MASSSSTTWLRNTSATDRATLIAGSGRPRVSRPTELRALMTRASSLPARPESTLYPMVVTSLLAIQLGGLRRSLVSIKEVIPLIKECERHGFVELYWGPTRVLDDKD